jgi:peptide/nickel transport system permease protein
VQGLAGYIVRRLLLVPIVLLAVSMITFALGRFAPSDYVEIQAGPQARPETIERIREARGLNDPVWEQYVRYMRDFLQGDFGESVRYRGRDVEDVILPRLWVTFQYSFLALILTFAIGLPVGTWAAVKRGTWMDPLSIGVFLLFASIPVIVLTPLLQWILGSELGLVPVRGWQQRSLLGVSVGIFSKHIILPVLILTLVGIAGIARFMRAQVIEVLDQDFIRTAHAKGLAADVVVTRHVVRNALLPIVTILGFYLAALFSGAIIFETLLGIPGIGEYAYDSVRSRDYDGIMAIVLIGATAFVFANLLVDIAYAFIDPRIRLGGEIGA